MNSLGMLLGRQPAPRAPITEMLPRCVIRRFFAPDQQQGAGSQAVDPAGSVWCFLAAMGSFCMRKENLERDLPAMPRLPPLESVCKFPPNLALCMALMASI